MKSLTALTADYFRLHELKFSSLAYWCFRFKRGAGVKFLEPAVIDREMNQQYSAEDQATDEDSVFSGTALVPTTFRPFAPVQIAPGWTPFAVLAASLSTPDAVMTDNSLLPSVAVYWQTPTFIAAKPFLDARDRRFYDILRRGLTPTESFGIVATTAFYLPTEFSPLARTAMAKAGFVIDSRS